MQAIILAAGTGSRIEAASEGRPKPLLEVGGKTLIEHQLEVLADAGIGPVTVVVGHKGDEVRRVVVVGHKGDEVRRVVGNRANFVENSDPKGTNSLYSFWLARERIRDDVIICNCDLLYHPEVIDRLLDVKGSALAYDSSFGWGRENMKVGIQEGCVREMSKALPYGRATGENLGLIMLAEPAAKVLAAKADAFVSEGKVKGWLAEALIAAAQEVPIRGVDIAGLPWIEIDFPQHLDNARRRVWPQIERDRWKRTVRWRNTRWLGLAVPVIAGLDVALHVGRWMEHQDTDWDSISIPGAPIARIVRADEDGTQRWWVVEADQVTKVEVAGPTKLRVEVRPLLAVPPSNDPHASPASDEMPNRKALFVSEVKVDGRSESLDVLRLEADEGVTWEGRPIGEPERMKVTIPAGVHVVEVGRALGPPERFLVRIREQERVEP